MRKLTTAQWAQITTGMAACDKAATNLSGSINFFNEAIDKARGDLGDRINEYNESVTALRDIYEDLASQAQTYYDDRTDAWKDSDAGSTYLDWIGRLESPEGLEDLEIDLPEDLEEPDLPDFTDTSWLPPESPEE